MVSPRAGPTPTADTRAPDSSSRASTYPCAAFGRSSNRRAPAVSSLQPPRGGVDFLVLVDPAYAGDVVAPALQVLVDRARVVEPGLRHRQLVVADAVHVVPHAHGQPL